MENLPEELLKGPEPLVYILGNIENSPEFHQQFIEAIQVSCNENELKPISFKSGAHNHEFPVKKNNGSQISTDGIFKSDWLYKHQCLLPSVVILMFEIKLDCTVPDWIQQESMIFDCYTRFKHQLSHRDAKVTVVLIRTGDESKEREVFEERFVSLKRHLNIEAKSIFSLTLAETNATSQNAKKIGKYVRECSSNYYKAHTKRLKRMEKLIGPRSASPLLFARYNFKAAIYCDFLGSGDKSLKHYQDSFFSLSNYSEVHHPDDHDQVDTFSAWINYCICKYYLLSSSHAEMHHQFRIHMNIFGRRYRGANPPRHFLWLANQYLIIENMLTTISGSSVTTEADTKYYFINAAKYISKAVRSAEKEAGKRGIEFLSPTLDFPSFLGKIYSNCTVTESRYIGGVPWLIDNADSSKDQRVPSEIVSSFMLQEYAHEKYSDLILSYLQRALEAANPTHERSLAYIKSLIGNQDLALSNYLSIVDLFKKSYWGEVTVPTLINILKCSINLGEITLYLKYAMHLFAIYRSKGCEAECASLERDIISLLSVTNSDELKVKISETMYYNNYNNTSSASQEIAIRVDEEYHKGIEVNSDEGFPLFTTEVKFNRSEIQMTDWVEGTLSISSSFNEELLFDKLKLYIGKEEDVVLTINHSNSTNDKSSSSSSSSQAASDTTASLSHSLLFKKGEVKVIDFKFNFDPEMIKRANKKVFTLDKIECIIARPYTSSDKQVNANREIIFSLNPFPLSFLKVLSSFPGTSPISEAIEAIMKPVPPAIYINGPESTLQLQSTNKIELLQGVIQRVDISFSTLEENITNGKLYFSYEFTTNSSDSPLFWYPKYTDFPISSSPEYFVNLNLDTIMFYPLLLDTNFQMSQPFSLPIISENSSISVPIFIRCESISNIKIKARFEYLHSSSKSDVVKEFDFYCNVVRPLSVNFSFITTREAACGVSPEDTAASLYRGDVAHMISTISCVKACKHGIGLVDLSLIQDDQSKSLFNVINQEPDLLSKGVVIRCSTDNDASTSSNLTSSPVSLNLDETFSAELNFNCLPDPHEIESTYPCSPSPPTNCSLGIFSVQWRAEDSNILFPIETSLEDIKKIDHVDKFLSLSKILPFFEVEKSCDATTATPIIPLDVSTSTTRKCIINFGIPSVQLIDAPFSVMVDSPNILLIGEEAQISIKITNKLLSSERISIKAEQPPEDNLLISGTLHSFLEIQPKGESTFSITVLPIVCGFVKLPNIKMIWDRHSLPVIELGTPSTIRSIYVKPSSLK